MAVEGEDVVVKGGSPKSCCSVDKATDGQSEMTKTITTVELRSKGIHGTGLIFPIN